MLVRARGEVADALGVGTLSASGTQGSLKEGRRGVSTDEIELKVGLRLHALQPPLVVRIHVKKYDQFATPSNSTLALFLQPLLSNPFNKQV